MRHSVLAELPKDLEIAGEVAESAPSPRPSTSTSSSSGTPRATLDTILQFFKSYYLTASRKLSSSPTVSVYHTTTAGSSVFVGSVSSPSLHEQYRGPPHLRPPIAVTELRLDVRPAQETNPPTLRLAVFFSTGQFSIFHLRLPSPTTSFESTEMFSSLSLPSSTPLTSADPVVLARFHSPILITCSAGFNLRFWRVMEGEEPARVAVEEAQPSMRSMQSWWPVVLTLAPVAPLEAVAQGEVEDDEWEPPSLSKEVDEETFKVTLAYSSPVFPSSWSVGIQQFVVTAPALPKPPPSSSTSSERHSHLRNRRITIVGRHATAPRARATVGPSSSRSRWTPSHDHDLVTSIEHADPCEPAPLFFCHLPAQLANLSFLSSRDRDFPG